MLHKNRWLAITFVVEVLLISIFALAISYNFLGATSFKSIYYLFGAVASIPFLYFLYRLREFDLIDLSPKPHINLTLLIAFMVPLLPAGLTSVIFLIFHINFFVIPVVLSTIVALIGLVSISIVSFGNFFIKKYVGTIIAILGIILAFIFIKGNIGSEYTVLFTIVPFFAGLCIALAKISTVEQSRMLVKLIGLYMASFIFILLSFFAKNLVITPIFSLSFKTPYQLFYTMFLILGLGLLFFAFVVFISIIINWEDQKTKVNKIYTDDNTTVKESSNLLIVKDNIIPIKSNFNYYLGFLPVWPRESLISPEGLKGLRDSSTHWYDLKPLRSNIFAGTDSNLYNRQTTQKIDALIKKLSQLAPELISDYVSFYEEIKRITGNNKELVVAVFNTVIGYDKYYWPNIHNNIRSHNSLDKFNHIMGSIANNKKIRTFKTSVNKAKNLKKDIDELSSE